MHVFLFNFRCFRFFSQPMIDLHACNSTQATWESVQMRPTGNGADASQHSSPGGCGFIVLYVFCCFPFQILRLQGHVGQSCQKMQRPTKHCWRDPLLQEWFKCMPPYVYSSCLFLNSCALGWKKVSLSATALQTSWTSRCGGKIHLRLPISSLRIFSLQENVSVYTLFLHASKLPVEWINIKHNPLLRLRCRDPWKILKMLQQASRAGSPVGSSKHCFPTKMRRLNAWQFTGKCCFSWS